MASWLNRTTEFWGEWGLRIAVLSSVTAHVALVPLAGTRRQHVSLLGALLLWPAYEVASKAGTSALGKLSLSAPSPSEQQLVAFWAPFLLLHLGRPDNISAYALEDNKLSWRQAVDVGVHVLGVMYVLYQYTYLCNSGDLFPAAAIMFAAGAAKYIERVVALWRGDLGNIRGSSSDKGVRCSRKRVASLTVKRVLDNEQALLLAHNLFDFCRRAMVDDSSVQEDYEDSSPAASEMIFLLEWSSMCKVVEMELSLMYDILYTKATVIHTWGGYVLRLLSPVASATAASLFWLFPKDSLRTGDIVITYILLTVALVMDVVWLVRALGSTWAYAFLNARPGIWLHHALLCGGWWRWLHRIVVSLDPSSLLLGRDASSYRRWSGIIGRYNLLDECTRARGLRSWILSKIGSEDSSYLSPLPPNVKRMLFQRIQLRLSRHPGDPYAMKDITTRWGQESVRRHPQAFDADDLPFFGREFQEDILVWHIGTSIFLASSEQQLVQLGDHGRYAEAIKVISEYLMFLVAMRRHMLPGLELRSLFEVTREALGELWIQSDRKGYSSSSRSRMEKLAEILREKKSKEEELYWGSGNKKRLLISDAAELAILLLEARARSTQELLELILDVWVDKLLYAGTRCSRESHAKQLSRGGELTTIVWIMTEHAGPFRIGQFAPGVKGYDKQDDERKKQPAPSKGELYPPPPPRLPPPPKKPEEEKPEEKKPEKKKPEEKKPEEKKPEKKKPEEKKPEEKKPEKKKPEEKPAPSPEIGLKPELEPRRRRRFATLYPPY